jgi:hypothetical protein
VKSHDARTRWPGISREVTIPLWARQRARHHRERLAAFAQPGTKLRVDIRALIDWRSLCRFDEHHVDIKIDWTLLEFVGLAGMLASDGLGLVEVAGTFDDVLLSAEFNKYEAAETILIGELQRLLCWRSIQHDNHHAALFFYRRFMDYCAGNQRAIKAYLKTLQRAEKAGNGAFDFLVGHEFGHFCCAHPDRLNEIGKRYAQKLDFSLEKPDFLEAISHHQVGFDDFLELVRDEHGPELLEELHCDCIGFAYAIMSGDTLTEDDLGRVVGYARVVHLTGVLAYLEATLFDDGAEDGLGAAKDMALLASVRSYYLIRHLIFFVTCVVFANRPNLLDRLVEVQESVEQFIKWLDRAIGLFVEKVVFWRFDLKDLGPKSFWLSPEQDVVIDHLRRYPNFSKEDYASAQEIAAGMARGWTVVDD